MGKKQTGELRRRVLSAYPKGYKLKHYRHGGYNNMKTHVEIITSAGNSVVQFSGWDLESALRDHLSKITDKGQ